jgi:hemerythrin-like domain-containing protein
VSTFQIGKKPPPGFDDPVGMLKQCHRRIEARLDSLPRIAAALREGRDEARPALADVVAHFDNAGRRHTEDEEFSLFPRIAGDHTNALLARLENEHREHDAIYLAFRAVSRKIIDDGPTPRLVDELAQHTAALSAAYRDHIAVEEQHLFPAAAVLDEAQLRAIGIEMRLRRGGGE